MLDRRNLLAGLAATAAAPAMAAPDARQLRSDAALLLEVYGKLHPGISRYNTEDDLARSRVQLEAELGASRTLGDAYLAFSRFTSAVRCGHSYLNPVNQGRTVREALFSGRAVLPLEFRWLSGRMIVTHDRSDARLAPGTEVLSINGYPARRLLSELRVRSRTDGGNEPKLIRNLDVDGYVRMPAFDVLTPMIVPGLTDQARLSVRPPRGAPRTIDVALLSHAERPVRRVNDGPLWTLERRPDGIAWLAMRDWAFYNAKDWESRLEADLDTATDARALVLDLRGNEGGLDVGDRVLSRMITADVPQTPRVRRVRYRRTPEALNPILDTWDPSFRDWGETAQGPAADGFYTLADGREGTLLRPRGRRLKGKLIVLTDASNSSATFQFAELVKTRGLGTLVGETTGGNRRGINGGAYFFVRLPASRLEVDLPLIGYFPPTPEPDAGIEPDVRVVETAADVAAGRDRARDLALRLARG